MLSEQCVQSGESTFTSGKTFPGADQLVYRRKGSAHQNVCSNHGTWGQLAVDDQQGAGSQRQRLLGIANELAPRRDAIGEGMRRGALRGGDLVTDVPAVSQIADHAH